METITIKPSNLNGSISVPGSKSITHRAYIIAALSNDESIIKNPLRSEDTNATLDVLSNMGAKFSINKDTIIFSKGIDKGTPNAYCANSGTTLRLMTGIAGLFHEPTILTGDDSLNKRPIGPLTEALSSLGLKAEDKNGKPPITVQGPSNNRINYVKITGEISSQFISSLILLSAKRGHVNTTIEIVDKVLSKPYIMLTIQMLREIGIEIEITNNLIHVRGHEDFDSQPFTIPADYSSMAFFIVAGALNNNSIELLNVNDQYIQADSAIVEIIKQFGGIVVKSDNKIDVTSNGLKAIDIDLENSPDLFPIVAVLAAKSIGTSRIYGASHLRFKESDRIKAVVEMLSKNGVLIEETNDGAIIHGNGIIPGGGEVNTYGDHRIAMAATIAASTAENPIKIVNPFCTGVSYPNFYEDFKKIGGRMV
jgi:3-phosphoshikimate 1-carboxyvinyltransferase